MSQKLSVVILSALLFILAGCGDPAVLSTSPSQGRYTVMLAQYSMEGSESYAKEVQSRAREELPDSPVWLERAAEGLFVNYGYFATMAQAEKALQRVKPHYAAISPGPLQFCIVRRIAPPDPPAPESWNLLNQSCGYSLEIAAYYDIAEEDYYDRKQDAVEHVKNLRDDNQSAYFVHGRSESRVYVGCFELNLDDVRYDDYGQPHFPGMIQMLIDRYPYRYENGDQVYDIRLDQQGKRVKDPRRPVLVNIHQLRQEIPY